MSDDRLPDLYRDIFESDARGAAILDDLHARFGVVRTHTDGLDGVLKTYVSNGKAAVIGYILNRIAEANGERKINPDDESQP